MLIRRITPLIVEDLKQKMVFLAGPRQCGKTTLAHDVLEQQDGRYYSWDYAKDRKALLNDECDSNSKLWVFDELHKNRRWRNWLKGIFDIHRAKHSILVTGSARLDLYSRGGDSLQGRYFFHRLHPFTLSEAAGKVFPTNQDWLSGLDQSQDKAETELFEALFQLGGFPEPFVSGSQRAADRWRLGYGTRLVRNEVASLESVQDLDRMELLFERLAQTVGAPLSINNLREDLEVAHVTAQKWIQIFERLYGVFRIHPFGAPRIKAVKKEAKLYFWDWGRVDDPAARFENMMAVHLLRLAHWLEDVEGKKCELRYFRTPVGHEVDFIFLIKGKPVFAVEAKLSDRPVDSSIKYLTERMNIPMVFQVSKDGIKDVIVSSNSSTRVRVMPGAKFLMNLP